MATYQIKISLTAFRDDEPNPHKSALAAQVMAELVKQGICFEATEIRGSYGELVLLIECTGGF